jgi:hypothetical protein
MQKVRRLPLKRFARYFAYSLAGLAALVIALAAAFTARLAVGPISLSFLAPALTESIAERLYWAYEVSFEDIRLQWSDGHGRLGLELVSVGVADYSSEEIASVPRISLGLPLGRLIASDYRPEAITVEGAKIRWIRTAGGAIKFDIGAEEPGMSGKILEDFLIMIASAPDPSEEQEPLPEMRIVDAEIIIGDELDQSELTITDADILIGPHTNGVRSVFTLEIANGSAPTRVSAEGLYRTADQHISLEVDIAELTPAQFARGEWAALTNLFFTEAVTGTATFEMDKFFGIEAATFDLRSASSRLAGEATADVRAVALRFNGGIAPAPQDLPLMLGPALPAWIKDRKDASLPLELDVSGSFDKFDNALSLEGHLGPPKTPISITGPLEQPVIVVTAQAAQ